MRSKVVKPHYPRQEDSEAGFCAMKRQKWYVFVGKTNILSVYDYAQMEYYVPWVMQEALDLNKEIS